MSEGARVIRPERAQLRWEMVDLDSQLPADHAARLVWGYVCRSDLSGFYTRIRARDATAGRPASDPAVLLALWLYATIEGVGAARTLARLTEYHAAYRWLRGNVPVNHDLLSAFRRDSGADLDELLTRGLTGLIAAGALRVEEVIIDGTKVAARAGRGSLAGGERLRRLEERVAGHVAGLKRALDEDPAGSERRRQEHALRKAAEQAARLRAAAVKLAELDAEKQRRAATHAKAEKAKAPPRVSTADPEVRVMRMADGAMRPAWNVQVATAQGFIVGIDPTDRRNDTGLASALLAQVEQRCGAMPDRLLGDRRSVTQDDVVDFATTRPGMTVYAPVPAERAEITAQTARQRRWRRAREADALRVWRERMRSVAGQVAYGRRKLTEHVHAKLKNRGFGRMPVHRRAGVLVVCLLHALAHNLLQAHRLGVLAP